MLFLVVNHCNAWTTHPLSHFLVRGRAYVLNDDGDLASFLATCPICHSTQASSLSISPIKMAQLSHVGCLLHASQVITLSTTLPIGLTCLFQFQTKVLLYWAQQQLLSFGKLSHTRPISISSISWKSSLPFL